MRPVNKGTHPSTTTSRGTTQFNLSEVYGLYLSALIGRLGEYCSYCEVPLGANLAVEHVLPKSKYPDEETTWENFLLACPNCNSRKSSRPDTRSGYAWPDKEDTFSVAQYYMDVDGLVKVRPNPSAGQQARDRLAATIDLVKLNAYDASDTEQKSDRRIINRTVTWNRAVAMATTLSGYYTGTYDASTVAQAVNDVRINLLKRQIRATAQASGFWSVWMTVFGAANFVTTATRDQLLCDLFVSAFPGTNFRIANTTCV